MTDLKNTLPSETNQSETTQPSIPGKRGTTLFMDPISVGIAVLVILGGIGLFSPKKKEHKPAAPTPPSPRVTINDVVVKKTGEEIVASVVKKYRGLEKGTETTYSRNFSINSGAEIENQVERGYSLGGGLGIANGSIERKVADSFGIPYNFEHGEQHSITLLGDSCPDFDVTITETWQQGEVSIPKRNSTVLELNFLTAVELTAKNLCDDEEIDGKVKKLSALDANPGNGSAAPAVGLR